MERLRADPREQRVGPAYPAEFCAREEALLAERRRVAGTEAAGPAIGAGLSGGGIRSATFALGVFQSLARLGLMRKIDFLATVSGGGYFGSFLGRLFTRQGATPGGVEAALGPGSPSVRFLRENGRYLAPKGGGDMLIAGAALLRNWVAVQVVTYSAIVTAFLALRALESIPALAKRLPPRAPGFPAMLHGAAIPLVLGVAVFLLCVVPMGWGYFTLREMRANLAGAGASRAKQGVALRTSHVWSVVLAAAAVFGVSWWSHKGIPSPKVCAAFGLAVVVPVLALLFALAARWEGAQVAGPATNESPLVASCSALRAARSRVSHWLKSGLVVLAVLLATALVGALGSWLYEKVRSPAVTARNLLAAIGGLSGLMALGKELLLRLGGTSERTRPKLSMSVVAYVAAALLALALLVANDALSRALTDVPALTRARILGPDAVVGTWWAAGAFVVAVALTYALGRSMEFVNLSSHHSLYSQRLTRAYLGASNPSRLEGKVALSDVTRGDDVALPEYYEAIGKAGAPLHLLNVTINETFDPKSEVQNQDRKGLPLAIGPCGMSVGIRHHGLHGAPKPPRPPGPTELEPAYDAQAGASHRVFPKTVQPEALRLGQWVAISGAAFSTGLGARTNLGMSLLCGLANVRLGYWWDAGVGDRRADAKKLDRPKGRKLWGRVLRTLSRGFPAHAHLFSEFLSRFLGTASRRWYLSDGGHFENLGGYELLRRKLKFILLVDDEADPQFGFEGLANLVRMARLDFGAEITFLDDGELDEVVAASHRPLFSKLEARRADGFSRAHASLARVDYADGRRGWLLYLKATLTGDEPQDVLAYHRKHPDFPHETTADQFFDEAQWESYRALGEHAADRVFRHTSDETDDQKRQRKWIPSDLFDAWVP